MKRHNHSPTRRAFVGTAGAFSAFAMFPRSWKLGVLDGGLSPGAATLARERYGKFLTEAQLPLLDEKLSSVEEQSKRLRSFKLKNGDGPTTDFRVVRR